jgi:hypothetical protein
MYTYSFTITCPSEYPTRLVEVCIGTCNNAVIKHIDYMGTDVHPATLKDHCIPLEGFSCIWTNENTTKEIPLKVTFEGPVQEPTIKVHYLHARYIAYLMNYREITVGRKLIPKGNNVYTYTVKTKYPTPRFLRSVSVLGTQCDDVYLIKNGKHVSCPIDMSTTDDLQIHVKTIEDVLKHNEPIVLLKIGGATPQII